MEQNAVVNVLGISGSLRKASYNTALLRAALELTPQGMTLDNFDLASIPAYNDDVREHGYPPAVEAMRARIRAADALLIATPEYNYSIPGVLKNALDWASRPPDSPLYDKPVAVMGATTGNFGTARAQMALRNIFVFNNMHPVNKPEVLVTRAKEKFDERGNLKDEETCKFIRLLLESLYDWTLRLRE